MDDIISLAQNFHPPTLNYFVLHKVIQGSELALAMKIARKLKRIVISNEKHAINENFGCTAFLKVSWKNHERNSDS